MPGYKPIIHADSYVFAEGEELSASHHGAKILNANVGALANERLRRNGPPDIPDAGRSHYPKAGLCNFLGRAVGSFDRLLCHEQAPGRAS